MKSPHPVEWTPASIARFWNSYESTKGMDLWHFARQRGRALLRYVTRRIALREPALDLGCGSGHLMTPLLNRGLKTYGADVSLKGLELVNARFSSHPAFLGTRPMTASDEIPFDNNTMGTIFLLETIEHLLPETLEGLFTEINRALAPGGALVITAPYHENLGNHTIECPACGATFHKTQHVRSCDEGSVTAIVRKGGLAVLSCKPALLLPSWGVWLAAQRTPARTAIACPECGSPCASPNRSAVKRLNKLLGELRHLVCIARKE
jgi:SAM-dependent methyltransferase